MFIEKLFQSLKPKSQSEWMKQYASEIEGCRDPVKQRVMQIIHKQMSSGSLGMGSSFFKMAEINDSVELIYEMGEEMPDIVVEALKEHLDSFVYAGNFFQGATLAPLKTNKFNAIKISEGFSDPTVEEFTMMGNYILSRIGDSYEELFFLYEKEQAIQFESNSFNSNFGT